MTVPSTGFFATQPQRSTAQAWAVQNSASSLEPLPEPVSTLGLSSSNGPRRLPTRAGRPLRIVSVGPGLVRGGAEQWLIYLSRFLNPGRLQVVRAIATNPSFVDPNFVSDVPVPVEVGSAEVVRRAAQDADIMLCWGIELDDILSSHRPKLCVYVAHGEGDWTRKMLSGSARSFDHVVAVSRRVQERVCQGYPSTVIHNGVDTARLGTTRPPKTVRRMHGFDDDDFVLGYLGRFSGEKQVHLIIDAVAELPPRFKAFFIGWGPGRQALLERANELIPGRYAFAAAENYLGDYYAAMDALCLVSNQEGFSLALLEAMWCERPVIVTPVGSVPEIIQDRVNGIVVSDNGPAIAHAARLVDQHPQWARGVAAEAKAFAEQRGHALTMARQYEDLLESLWCERYGSAA